MKTLNLLRNAYVLELLGDSFSAASLSRRAGMSYGHTSSTLRAMLRRGLVRKVRESHVLGSGGRSNLKGLDPALYRLTPKGRSGIKVVLTGGVFDIIHPGHISMLEEAGTHGDVLVVVVARDSSVRKRKTVTGEGDRLLVVSSLKPVDAAILGSSTSYLETIERVGPDIISLGYDQDEDLRRISRIPGRGFRIVRTSGHPEYSTSRILKTIKGS